MYDVIVIGAGASGMTAAIEAAKGHASVLLLEKMNRTGKKILATGNGKCNLTNSNIHPQAYRGKHPEFAYETIEEISPQDVIDYFLQMGVLTRKKDSYVYPYNEQAVTIADALHKECEKYGVKIRCDCPIKEIRQKKNHFEVLTAEDSFSANYVVLGTGGKAYANLGSDGSGYVLAKQLGHTVTKTYPALCGLVSGAKYFKEIAGVRSKGRVTLKIDGKKKISVPGEIQFTKYGISGIPVFEISRYAAEALDKRQEVVAELDLFPEYSFGELKDLFVALAKREQNTSIEEYLGKIVNQKWVLVILKEMGLKKEENISKIKEPTWKKLTQLLKNWPVLIKETMDFSQAQVTAGGVDVKEITKTMESKKVPGLFMTGELLDIDGTCGGYNLQWAFASGIIAGRQIAKQIERKRKKK